MRARHLELLVEDASMKAFLRVLVPPHGAVALFRAG